MDNVIRNLEALLEKIAEAIQILKISTKEEQIEIMSQKQAESGFWDNPEEAGRLSKNLEELKREVAEWRNLEKEIISSLDMSREAEAGGHSELLPDLEFAATKLQSEFAKMEFALLFNGEYDNSNAFVAVHAGTGGTEAQDWAEMLERMYLRYAEKQGWQAEILEYTAGNEAGIKSVLFKVSGRWAYGNLKSEAGVHRLVRISPFDAEALRQTSFALVEILPELSDKAEVEIKPEDIEIEFHRSGGPGGQNVNKVSSAVRIKHLPTGIVVGCQSERSQSQNREQAMALLRSKLALLEEKARAEKTANIRGEVQKAEWGKQIRSYVLQPYQMVKDHRTNAETSDAQGVLDGDIQIFIESYLKQQAAL